MMKRTIHRTVATLMVGIIGCATLTACSVNSNSAYLEEVDAYSFWSNDSKNAVPQYRVFDHMNDYLSDGNIENGDVVAKDGRIKKVLFLGFDGMRADALTNVFFDESDFQVNGYNREAVLSGLNDARKKGGAYIAYCGGEKGTDTQQSTSTSASWTSQLTGVWGTKHGIKENDNSKNLDYKTIMLQYAEKGLQTSFAFDWDPIFDVNFKEEMKYVLAHPELAVTFCDIDRKKADSVEELKAESMELYNMVAGETPSENEPYDVGMRDYILERINTGDDLVAGIFHNIDSNGHTYAFSNEEPRYVNSVRNCDTYAYQILEAIKQREEQNNEQWLVVMANDHGGIGQRHGKQTLEERTTWIVSNYQISEKYFSENYDGFKLK